MRPLLAVLFLVGRIFSPAYSLVMLVRAYLYRNDIFLKSQRLPVPVISIGNLTLGGTGKTPMVRYVARLLMDRGVRPAIVSRGYGGKAAGRINIVADRTKTLLPPEMAGDEPFMLAEALPGVPVLTGSQRARVARHAVEVFGANLIVMDDGFQHFALERDADIVLVNATAPFYRDRVLPSGDLREAPSGLERAAAVVITHCEQVAQDAVDELRAEIKRIQDEGVSTEELARVKIQSIAAQIYKRDSLMAQAMEIGGAEAAGQSWRDIDTLLEKIKTVTSEEVQAVARKYFTDDTLSIAVLDPQPVDQSKPKKPSGAVRH